VHIQLTYTIVYASTASPKRNWNPSPYDVSTSEPLQLNVAPYSIVFVMA